MTLCRSRIETDTPIYNLNSTSFHDLLLAVSVILRAQDQEMHVTVEVHPLRWVRKSSVWKWLIIHKLMLE
jgi:hypothetical protein